jgi:hypothetical protein
MTHILPRYVTERIGPPPWDNCVCCSGLMLANKASGNAKPATSAEVLALRTASGASPHGPVNFPELVHAYLVRYDWHVSLASPTTAEALYAGLLDFSGAVVVLNMGMIPAHFRRFDPAFALQHACYVQISDGSAATDHGALWLINPMAPKLNPAYRGEWIHVSDLAPAYVSAIVLHEDQFAGGK